MHDNTSVVQGWRDQDDEGAPAYDQLLKNVDEEEEQLQREEQYEASYNFRFEVSCTMRFEVLLKY